MAITRRQALLSATIAPLAAMHAFAAFRALQPAPEAPPDEKFTPPPSPPTKEELALLATAASAAKSASVSDLVRDPRFLTLHPQPAFREIVRSIARDPLLTIPREDEPGTRIIVTGKISDANGRPVAGALVYAYHTSAKGWYSDKAAHIRAESGDTKHARLFGYLKTGPDGSFEIRTVRPGGYPQSNLPQHIHAEMSAAGFGPLITELLFDDDPRLTSEQRDRAKREGFIIAAGSPGPEGGTVFPYSVVLRKQ